MRYAVSGNFWTTVHTKEEIDLTLFGAKFFICNLYLVLAGAFFLLLKRLLKNRITERAQYNLWFFFLALLIIPFLPFELPGILHFVIPGSTQTALDPAVAGAQAAGQASVAALGTSGSWINDFSVSARNAEPPIAGLFFCILWLCGTAVMLFLLIRSRIHFHVLERSALPLENEGALDVFSDCCRELHIRRSIPVYTTPYLKSPVTSGSIRPRIYIPLHLLSDFDSGSFRYIMLHELQHYRHLDAVAGQLINLAATFYWFNPMVHHVLRQMRNDRELACDSSVLSSLAETEYTAYGHTLINFAEKISKDPFPAAAGIGGNIKQIRSRILHIASHRPVSKAARLREAAAYLMSLILLFGLAPSLAAYAGNEDHSSFDERGKEIAYLDLSGTFDDYDGSFVLYDAGADQWQIYNRDMADLRVSPDSTYKIYDALLALESGIITPEDTLMEWDGATREIDAWNADQDLGSAMQNSVNWYFQTIDRSLGEDAVSSYYDAIDYGNEDTSGGIDSYWMESTLQISPLEQVELLQKLYRNEFHFQQENIDAVIDSMRLSSGEYGTLYGKTGTGKIEGKEGNGWFVGFIESPTNTYFFAVNIQGADRADGASASNIALAVLEDAGIWNDASN